MCLGPRLVTLWSAMRLEVTWQNRRHDNSDNSDNSMIIASMSFYVNADHFQLFEKYQGWFSVMSRTLL